MGTTVTFRLSEAANAVFTVERAARGYRRGRRCVSRRRKGAKRCTRYVRQRGSFSMQGKAGSNGFKFTGRLRKRKLSPGPYRLVMQAIDAAGNRSLPIRSSFRIVRR